MITKLIVKDWKSFHEGTLYIDPLTIMIGNNASGKSNILDALLLLQRLASGVSIYQAINGDITFPAIRGGIEWVCRKPEKRFTIELAVQDDNENQEYLYQLTIQVNTTRAEVVYEELILRKYNSKGKISKESRLYYSQESNDSTPGIPVCFSTKTQGPGKRIDLSRSSIILSQAEGLSLRQEIQVGIGKVLSQIQKVFIFDPIPSHMRSYSPFADKLISDGSNISGVLAALEPENRNYVEDTLTKYLKYLPEKDIRKVWSEPVGKFGTDAMLYCEEGWAGSDNHIVDARGMSDGTLRYLAIVTAMLTRESGSLLVIEEVDNGLHPSRAKILIQMLKELGNQRGIDVVVTTHNPALLDAAGPEMIPFITVVHRNASTGASDITQLEDLNHLPKLMAGGSLGQLSTAGRIEETLSRDVM